MIWDFIKTRFMAIYRAGLYEVILICLGVGMVACFWHACSILHSL